MSENNNSYKVRINTKVREDKYLNVNINQDIEQLEILSLKLDVDNFYKLHTSDYGCIVGRVLANKGVGIPNVKISVFIPVESADLQNPVFRYLYPYTNVKSKNQEGIRYNLLPDHVDDKCHQDVGTFPNKRLVLDDSNVYEVFDKYFKYTTVTNSSGDYMLFGIPVGLNTIHSELDLSDIGALSQKPRDLYYKGYGRTLFENSSQFKKDTNLDYLTQVITQDNPVQVYPFWGDDETKGYDAGDSLVKITRSDIDINYKFEPTCIFIGSLVADDKSNGFSKRCIPTDRSGKMDRLTTGCGTIEMIRKTPDGKTESFSIQGNDLIDGNGTWCYQIPMNLDYIKMDEYGNFIPAENESTGIPTRTRVRFRISLADYESDSANAHLPKILVPNNPEKEENTDYVFGTDTRDDSYRDLFWNNVYSVKEYIPRIQKIKTDGKRIDKSRNFSGIKAVNVNGANNPIPYNNIRVNLTFLFIFQCIIFKSLVAITRLMNGLIFVLQYSLDVLTCRKEKEKCGASKMSYITMEGGMCPSMEGWKMALGAHKAKNGASDNKSFSASKLIYVTWKAAYGEYDINGSTNGEDDNDKYTAETENSAIINSQFIDEKSSDSKYNGEQKPEGYEGNSDGLTELKDEAYVSANGEYYIKCVELQFAMEYEVIQFDFYNDWINGMIYLPRWFAELKRRKRVDKVIACNEHFDGGNKHISLVEQCAIGINTGISINGGGTGITRNNNVMHRKNGRKYVEVFKNKGDGGIIQTVTNKDNRKLYYLKPKYDNIIDDKEINLNLFSSDIILLGSTENCNKYGIPMANGYPSSSFVMPPPTGQIVSDFQEMEMSWSYDDEYSSEHKNKEDFKDNGEKNIQFRFKTQNKKKADADGDETELSGIDWGYNPFKTGSDDNTKKIENQQGGHFLEIGCVASAVNNKSCVNLKRICELGAEMAQSHVYYIEENSGETFIGTTGVVSGREVISEEMRTKFAVLNSNELVATDTDKETGYPIYKFNGYTPYNFNGMLKNVKDSNGNSFLGDQEIVDKSYNLFRLGSVNRYALSENHIKYIPIYNNSFYFYFGLKDGNTAIDRLYSEYFSECTKNNETE